MNWLSPHQAAIDWDHRPGHIVGQIGREELDDLGAILDGAKPPKGDQLGAITIALNAARNHGRHNPPGGDHAGGDAIRGDAEGTEILRQIPRSGIAAFAAP